METNDYKTKLVPCSQCGAPVLPELSECMFCGQKDPGRLAANPIGARYLKLRDAVRKRSAETNTSQLFVGERPLTNLLVGISIAAYLLLLMWQPGQIRLFDGPMQLLAPAEGTLAELGATGRIPFSNYRLWTVFTAGFVHANLVQIVVSLIFLWVWGGRVEAIFGRSRTFILYMGGCIIGWLMATMGGALIAFGSSAGFFALIGAAITAARGTVESQQRLREIAIWGGGAFILAAAQNRFTDNWAHVAAIVTGLALAHYMIVTRPYDVAFYDNVAKGLGVAAVVSFVLAVIFGFF